MYGSPRDKMMFTALEGVVFAAVFTVALPWGAFAQNLSAAVTQARGALLEPFIVIVSYISYSMGAVMAIASIAGAKRHADNPGQNPLGPVLGRFGAGIAFLSAPTVVRMVQQAGSDTFGSGGAFVKWIGF